MTIMTKVNHIELRTQLDMRGLIDKYVHNGWSLETREPTVIITRGRIAKHVDHGVLKDGRPTEDHDEQNDQAKPNHPESGTKSGEAKAIL